MPNEPIKSIFILPSLSIILKAIIVPIIVGKTNVIAVNNREYDFDIPRRDNIIGVNSANPDGAIFSSITIRNRGIVIPIIYGFISLYLFILSYFLYLYA